MNNLPPEILSQVFSLLYQRDRVKCMTVCRHWQRTINNSSLFGTICLSNVDQFLDLMYIIESDEELGLHTSRLILDLGCFNNPQLEQFPMLFPNVHDLYLTGLKEAQVKNSSFQSWRDHLEVLIEDQSSVFTWQFLASGLCSRLKTISFRRLLKRFKEFIVVLANAPFLQSLELTHISITLNDLEQLHDTVPLLKRLVATSVVLKDSNFPTRIQPASAIRSISFGVTNGIEKQSEILQYVSRKYTHLEEFSFNDTFNKLSVEEFDARVFDNGGFTSLFEQLYSNLTTLEITFTHVPVTFFSQLDNAHCQIRNLTLSTPMSSQILLNLSLSDQARYIQSLTLSKIMDIDDDFTFLKQLVALKELRLSSKYKKIRRIVLRETSINYILDNVCDSVKFLALDGFNLSCSIPTDSRVYPIKKLVLESIVLPTASTTTTAVTRLDDFLSVTCPQLRFLTLDSCELCDTKNGQFRLPLHHLSYLEIKEDFTTKEGYMLLLTSKKDDNKKTDDDIKHNTRSDVDEDNKKGKGGYDDGGDDDDDDNKVCSNIKQHSVIYKPRSFSINKHFHVHDNAVQGFDQAIPYATSTKSKPFITIECASVDTVILLNNKPLY